MLDKILIANRGEIAVRIIRACREMGITSVAVYSEADREARHVSLADESICIGPAPAAGSYLNMRQIVSAALAFGAQGIHPGYGFLSENPEFAALCREKGLIFVGPSAEAIRAMGDKSTAKQIVTRGKVPVVPGSEGLISHPDEALAIAAAAGYPVIVKATAGGGGRGMRIAQNPGELKEAVETASLEAAKAFGNPGVYVEKYLERPRHVEVQVLADRYGHCVHFGERDCSVQRRHQKLIEEAPSPALDEATRKTLGKAAVEAAKAAGYEGAGTVEFLLDQQGNYYFIEMNTRIQVEHPVTEMVTGVDLVKWQIRIAAGEELTLAQKDIRLRGWAVECRINAEDPDRNFAPSPGRLTSLILPGGPGIRVDTAMFPGAVIPPWYDSLIAKVIAWGQTRQEALDRVAGALREMEITGVATTIPFQLKVLAHKDFRAGTHDTGLLEELL
jgi:acetyl-CoA carboxylase biotin carboxylase subunit